MSEIGDLDEFETGIRGDTLSEKAARISATMKKRRVNAKRLDVIRPRSRAKLSALRRAKFIPVTLPKISI